MRSTISFPGLGIGEFEINRTAFSIKNINVTWYGMIICLGIILAFAYFCYRVKKEGLDFDTMLDYALITVPTAIVGARLYYIIFNPADYKTFYDIIAIWNGGIAIYGGIIGGAVAVFLVSKFKKKNFFTIADSLMPGVMLGQLIGRWGNFMNGEAFGGETTLPWRMRLCNKLTDYQVKEVHPTFLYESLWNLLGFILINVFYKHRKFRGEVLFWYLSWYGLGRFFIENLRTDSLYLGNTNIRVSALLGLVCFAVALPVIIIGRIRHAKLCKEGIWEKDAIADFGFVFGLKKAEVKSREEMMDLITSMLTTDEIDATEASEEQTSEEATGEPEAETEDVVEVEAETEDVVETEDIVETDNEENTEKTTDMEAKENGTDN